MGRSEPGPRPQPRSGSRRRSRPAGRPAPPTWSCSGCRCRWVRWDPPRWSGLWLPVPGAVSGVSGGPVVSFPALARVIPRPGSAGASFSAAPPRRRAYPGSSHPDSGCSWTLPPVAELPMAELPAGGVACGGVAARGGAAQGETTGSGTPVGRVGARGVAASRGAAGARPPGPVRPRRPGCRPAPRPGSRNRPPGRPGSAAGGAGIGAGASTSSSSSSHGGLPLITGRPTEADMGRPAPAPAPPIMTPPSVGSSAPGQSATASLASPAARRGQPDIPTGRSRFGPAQPEIRRAAAHRLAARRAGAHHRSRGPP